MDSEKIHELMDKKIESCRDNCKPDTKLEKTTFWTMVILLNAIIGGLIGNLYIQLGSLREASNLSIMDIKISLAKIEANSETTAKTVDNINKVLSNYNVNVK